jgi:hypothetical protein
MRNPFPLDESPFNGMAITPSELLERFPGIDGDIEAVGEWMQGGEFAMQLAQCPISRFSSQISSCHESYPKFPGDEVRAMRILRRLRNGAEPWPLFVDGDDFVMEGRHRMVAFHLFGLETIPVVFVK